MKAETIPDNLLTIWHYPLVTLGEGISITPSQIVMSLLLTLIGLLVARVLTKAAINNLIKANVDSDSANTIGKIIFYILVLVVLLTALRMLQIPLTALTFMSGAIAIGIGFGAQNILNNFISGWIFDV